MSEDKISAEEEELLWRIESIKDNIAYCKEVILIAQEKLYYNEQMLKLLTNQLAVLPEILRINKD